MTYDPELHHRRTIRKKGYDYNRAGAYFVTICVQDRSWLLGAVVDGAMGLVGLGRIVQSVWEDLPNHYSGVALDRYVIMPNHVHGIIVLDGDCATGNATVGAGFKPAPTGRRHGLPEIIRGFKTFSARQINATRHTPGVTVWQRNYYERIIRNREEWQRLREYIDSNPERWTEDELFEAWRHAD